MTEPTDTEPTVTFEPDASVDPELVQAASIIGSLSSHPTLSIDLEAIVERSLGESELGLFDQMRGLARNLELYFGDPSTASWLLIAISSGSADMDGFDLLGEVADSEARASLEMMLRRMGGLYGDTINRGLNLTSRPPEDWQYINVTTRYEVENARWLIDLELDRFDGEKVRIYGDSLSMIRLVNRLLSAINSVGTLTEDYHTTLSDEEDVAMLTAEVHNIFEGLGLFEEDEEGDAAGD